MLYFERYFPVMIGTRSDMKQIFCEDLCSLAIDFPIEKTSISILIFELKLKIDLIRIHSQKFITKFHIL